MNKLSGFLSLFFLILACTARAQQDTAADKGWNSMPVVADTQAAAMPPQTPDSTNYLAYVKDSLKKVATDSINKVNDSLKNLVDEKEFIKNQIKVLCGKEMHGRGYVKDGWDSAAKYVLRQFKKYKLQPVTPGGPYAQGFAFEVNTFPGKMILYIGDDSLSPAVDFLIDPASAQYLMDSGASLRVTKVNLGKKISDTAAWNKKLLTLADSTHAYFLKNIDDLAEKLGLRKDQIIAQLPKGVFLLPQEGDLKWALHREQMAATVFYVQEDSLPKKIKRVSVNVNAQYNPHQRSENIIAMVPGEVPDTFVAFTAHYDHLGMMGSKTTFQGASDNASGTAMLIYLASYFAKHPQHYSILFIAFGAEEASLMGSEFYVWHPFVPLKNIKFLTNIDIMGDATFGMTVVNATDNINEFSLLNKINEREKYVRMLMPRDNAANSDQYYFAKKHVPCFYVYSNGGNRMEHDIYDVKSALSLKHIDDIAQLLIDFTKEIKDVPPHPVIAPPPSADNTAAPTDLTQPPGEMTPPPAEKPAPQRTAPTPGDNAPPQEMTPPPAGNAPPPQEVTPPPADNTPPPADSTAAPKETPGK